MSHSVEGIIGPFIVGGVLSCFMSGIVLSQVFQYHVNFPNDRSVYKSIVYGLLVLDLTHTAINVWTMWDWCVTNYGGFQHLAMSPWSYGAAQVLLGVIALVCRTFYAYRVWVVSKRSNLVLPIVIMILSLASLGCAIGAAITVFTKKYFSKFAEFSWGISVWLAIATGSDAVITGSLVYYLAKSKSGGLHSTNSQVAVAHSCICLELIKRSPRFSTRICRIINKLIELLVSTNGLTVLVGFVTGLLFWTIDAPYHIGLNLTLAKFYTSSLLVSLNAHVELERRLNQHSSATESHGLTEIGVTSTTRTTTFNRNHDGASKKKFHGLGGKRDLRTALGFGREDVDVRYDNGDGRRSRATRSLGEGIQIVTHQTVVTDGDIQTPSTAYLSTPTSEKSLAYYSNEKEEEAADEPQRNRPIRATHFADELGQT
ncbi:hypothetical protein JCM3766R1_000311 [Sporobolomyces carnicolor]